MYVSMYVCREARWIHYLGLCKWAYIHTEVARPAVRESRCCAALDWIATALRSHSLPSTHTCSLHSLRAHLPRLTRPHRLSVEVGKKRYVGGIYEQVICVPDGVSTILGSRYPGTGGYVVEEAGMESIPMGRLALGWTATALNHFCYRQLRDWADSLAARWQSDSGSLESGSCSG